MSKPSLLTRRWCDSDGGGSGDIWDVLPYLMWHCRYNDCPQYFAVACLHRPSWLLTCARHRTFEGPEPAGCCITCGNLRDMVVARCARHVQHVSSPRSQSQQQVWRAFARNTCRTKRRSALPTLQGSKPLRRRACCASPSPACSPLGAAQAVQRAARAVPASRGSRTASQGGAPGFLTEGGPGWVAEGGQLIEGSRGRVA